jgi:ABC-type antimicrobial peptide transport system permease subunit
MNLLVMNRIALRTLARSKLRTRLTTLGIAIGAAAVVSTVAIGEGAARLLPRSTAARLDPIDALRYGG